MAFFSKAGGKIFWETFWNYVLRDLNTPFDSVVSSIRSFKDMIDKIYL